MATQQQAWDIARLYEAGLDRDGDIGRTGLNFWVDKFDEGASRFEIADAFLESREFTEGVGDIDALSNEELVNGPFENVIGRSGRPEGVEFWTGRLEEGASRAELLHAFATSPENAAATAYVEEIEEVAPGEWFYPDEVPDGPASQQFLPVGGEASGLLRPDGDSDWYRAELDAQTVYDIAVEGREGLDPELRLFSASAGDTDTPFAFNDDGGPGLDPRITFQPIEDAGIFVAVSGFGSSTGEYDVTLSEAADQSIENAGDKTTNGIVRLQDGMWSSDEGATNPGSEVGPSDTNDWWEVFFEEGETYEIALSGAQPDPISDPDLFVRDAAGDDLARSRDVGDDALDYEADDTGTHYLDVERFAGEGDYTLEVEVA